MTDTWDEFKQLIKKRIEIARFWSKGNLSSMRWLAEKEAMRDILKDMNDIVKSGCPRDQYFAELWLKIEKRIDRIEILESEGVPGMEEYKNLLKRFYSEALEMIGAHVFIAKKRAYEAKEVDKK